MVFAPEKILARRNKSLDRTCYLTKEQRDEHIRRYAELIEAREIARQGAQDAQPVLADGRRQGPQHKKSVSRMVAEETGVSLDTVKRARSQRVDPPKESFDVHEQARRRMMSAWNAATDEDRQW